MILQAAAEHPGGALATVLSVEGSAYRRAGSRMLVLPDGSTVGGVSGGCLEAEVAAEALQAAADGRARVLRFDTTDPDDAVMGYGSGCAGVIDVLVEPRGPGAADVALAASAEARATRRAAVLVTATAGPLAGAHGWWRAGGWVGDLATHLAPHDAASLTAPRTGASAVHDASRSAGTGQVLLEGPGGPVPAVWEVVAPPVQLVHVGADAGAPEMASAARHLGWDVVVTDFRPRLLDSARFAPGVRLVEAGGEDLGRRVLPDALTAVLVASRHWLYDRAAVETFAGAPAGTLMYLGLIGSHARVGGLLAGVATGAEGLLRVHAPAGRTLGARTPAEIAVSVVSEVLGVRPSPAALLPGSASLPAPAPRVAPAPMP